MGAVSPEGRSSKPGTGTKYGATGRFTKSMPSPLLRRFRW
ncbi:Uncharacterised protein [Mycobacteroides abscessus subsp. abscessus]|nr:Uncharacterised protein [Mycobacteroides abscessus subsp. abscessus]